MIDHFASQDIEREGDGETLADWLARHLGEHAGEARARLAAMQRVRATEDGVSVAQAEQLRAVA